MTRDRFSRVTAYHEAGHVVACCRLLHGIHSARVFSKTRGRIVDRRGRVVRGAYGTTEPCGCFNTHLHGLTLAKLEPEEGRRAVYTGGFRHIIMTLAGGIAEARYTRRHTDKIMRTSAREDIDDVTDVGMFLAGGDEAELRDIVGAATQVARVLVSRDWQKIVAVAEKLARVGVIEGDDALLETIEPAAR